MSTPLKTDGTRQSWWSANYDSTTRNCRAYKSRRGVLSAFVINGVLSLAGLNVILSLCSVNAFGSIVSLNSGFSVLSVNSLLSVCSANSFMAVGCSGKALKICIGDEDDDSPVTGIDIEETLVE